MLDSVTHIHARSSSILILAYRIYTHIKLCFLHACIDMDSFEIVYLSSDDESPFERNQRLLREHQEEEDQRRVQNTL